MSQNTSIRLWVGVLATALGLTACAGPSASINAAFHPQAVNVRIGDAAMSTAVAPIPPIAPPLSGEVSVPPAPISAHPVFAPPPPLPTAAATSCPKAPTSASAQLPNGVAVTKGVAPGEYSFRTAGKHTVGGANTAVTDYPPVSIRAVRNLRRTTAAGQLTLWDFDELVKLGATLTQTTYRVVPEISNDPAVGADPAPGLYVTLIKTADASGRITSSFEPNPPMLVIPFPATPGQTWHVASIDPTTGVGIAYDGVVGKQVEVDACGQLIDTREVVHTGTVSIRTCDGPTCTTPNTQTAASNFTATYDIAMQYGGISVQDDVKVTGLNPQSPYTDDLSGVIDSLPNATS